MTLTLDLSPSEEKDLQTGAAHDGVPVGEYARNLFATALRQKTTAHRRAILEAEAAEAFAASGETEEDMEAYIQQAVREVRAELSARDAHP